jgi:carboxypeptidase Taq
MADTVTTLKTYFGEIADIETALQLAEWDQLVMMRPRGFQLRGEVLGTLSQLLHEKWIDPHFGELLDQARTVLDGQPADDPMVASIRVATRERDRKIRVPVELAGEMSRISAVAYAVWVDARKNADFAAFAPYLQQIFDLQLRYIDCFDAAAHPYDTLLARHDLEFTTAELNVLFDQLVDGFRPIIQLVGSNPAAVSDACYRGQFPKAKQAALCEEFMLACGARDDVWRLDETVHPFETAMSMDDVRITTRYDEENLADAFFGTLHETGHGLYEDGVDRSLARLPVGVGGTLDMHESQSRMIENLVGRSRPFYEFALPIFRKHFPDEFASVDAETLYRGANIMRPSFIRVEADESTYNMHIALRFRIEQRVVNGELAIKDLPEAWNAEMQSLLGVTPPNDREGLLQDVHWSHDGFGSFVGYSLGNVIGAQLWSLIERNLPGLDGQFAAGDFSPLREWLRTNIHSHGRTYGTKETLAKLGIERLDPEPLRASIAAKAESLYGAQA